jgi:hypothetical protein
MDTLDRYITFFSKISKQYCNCYRYPNEKIEVKCYDTMLEAINTDEKSVNMPESRMIGINLFIPKFIINEIINKQFNLKIDYVNQKK